MAKEARRQEKAKFLLPKRISLKKRQKKKRKKTEEETLLAEDEEQGTASSISRS